VAGGLCGLFAASGFARRSQQPAQQAQHRDQGQPAAGAGKAAAQRFGEQAAEVRRASH